MELSDVFYNKIIDWISNHVKPEDVYGHDNLIEWAKKHGMAPLDDLFDDEETQDEPPF